MARIRSLKPDIWDDDAIGDLTRDERLLFVALITQADDDGRLPGRPKWIASKMYPYDDDVTPEDVSRWLAGLDAAGLIWLYETDGKPYIWLPKWESHQSIDSRYRKESKLPDPPDERPSSAPRALVKPPPDARRRSGEERKGGDGRGKESSAVAASDAPLSNLLADLLAELDPNGKRPTVSQTWATEEDRMLRLDGRDPVEAERLIRWTMRDPFWQNNVKSMPKFREQYAQLYGNAKNSGRPKGRDPSPGLTQAQQRWQEIQQRKAAKEAA